MNSSNDDTEDLNGLIFNSCYFPEEIVSYILSFVDPPSLVFQCRLVCKNWKYIIDENVWKILTRYAKQKSFSKLSYSQRITLNLPWYVYYAVFSFDPFERNLIKNNCGQGKTSFFLCFLLLIVIAKIYISRSI